MTGTTDAKGTAIRRPAGAQVGAEVALAAVSLATVYGFSRLYADGSFFPPLALLALAAHVVAAACRRRRVPPAASAAIAAVGGILATAWTFFPSATWFGVPTPHTLAVAHQALSAAVDRFGHVVAPAPVLPGFQLTAGFAVWGMVWFADWSAFRIWATAESVAPAAVLFVFGALLGAPRHRTASTAVFVAAVLVFILLHRTARQDAGRTWVTPSSDLGHRALWRAGALGIAVAVTGGVVLGPHIPGANGKPVVSWRQSRVDRSRVTVSPLVDIRKRLVDKANTLAFDVTTTRPSYWRLTSLDSFDGQIWSSNGSFTRAGSQLPPAGQRPPASRTVKAHIQIADLSAIWVPAAYEARSVDAHGSHLRWDPTSGTLIVDNDRTTSDRLDYDVVSAAPVFTSRQLQAATGRIPEAIQEQDLALPRSLPAKVVADARVVTQHASTPYEEALDLQNWFRTNFTYNLAVRPGHNDNAILEFLNDRKGYCEQFAGTYAAMARAVGLPARVAVGFTPGDPDPDIPNLYHVKGKHAHAWPEVYFAGLGWVPFEPTPGRGQPGAQAWTGVKPQQDTPAVPRRAATTTTTTIATNGTTPASAGANNDQLRALGRSSGSGPKGGASSTTPLVLAALALVLLLAWMGVVLFVPIVRHRRRRRAARTAADRIELAWIEANEPIGWLTGARPGAWESHAEFAVRLAPSLGELGAPHRELADLATIASWSGTVMPDADAERARTAAREVAAGARRRLTFRQWLRRRLSLRRALRAG